MEQDGGRMKQVRTFSLALCHGFASPFSPHLLSYLIPPIRPRTACRSHTQSSSRLVPHPLRRKDGVGWSCSSLTSTPLPRVGHVIDWVNLQEEPTYHASAILLIVRQLSSIH